MTRIEAVISDFGGVLTTSMRDGFVAYEQHSGISAEQLGTAMGTIWARDGAHPLFELETGRITEAAFVTALGDELSAQLDREVRLDDLGEVYFQHLHPNDRAIQYMRSLRDRGYRLAICTNNVREWEPLWRSMLPVDEIFDVVVDSAFVGLRKPEPEIYALTLERLGAPAASTVFVDDIELNCKAATELGLRAVHFRDTEQAIEDIEAALAAA
jgi:epoxide hydrolase-like predicted phosphatase